MEKIIEVSVHKQKLAAKAPCRLVAGSSGRYFVKLKINDEEWNGIPYILLQFKGCEKKEVEVGNLDEIIEIPWECIKEPCILSFALLGMDGNGELRLTTYSESNNSLVVWRKDWKDGEGQDDLSPTPNMWEVEKKRYDELESQMNNAIEELNNQMNSIIDGSVTSIKSNAKNIRSYAFYQSKNILDSTFPLVEKIGTYAFGGCSNLTSIDLSSVAEIGAFAFNDCSNLRTVILRDKKVCTWLKSSFSNTPITIPIELVDLQYNLATNGDFSKGREGWSSNYDVDNHPTVVDGYGVYTGRWNCYSAATYTINRSFSTGDVIEFAFDVKLEQNYAQNGDVSFAYWFEGSDGAEGVKYTCYDANGNVVYGNAETWTRVHGTYTVPTNTDNLTIYIGEGTRYSGSRNGTFYIDNLYIGTGDIKTHGNVVVNYNSDTNSLDGTFPWTTGILIKAPTNDSFNKVEITYTSDNPLNVYLFDSNFTDGVGQYAAGQHEVTPKISAADTDNTITWEYTADVVKAIKFVALDRDTNINIKSVKFIGKGKVGYMYVPKELIEDYEKKQNLANHFRAIEDYPEICGM